MSILIEAFYNSLSPLQACLFAVALAAVVMLLADMIYKIAYLSSERRDAYVPDWMDAERWKQTKL